MMPLQHPFSGPRLLDYTPRVARGLRIQKLAELSEPGESGETVVEWFTVANHPGVLTKAVAHCDDAYSGQLRILDVNTIVATRDEEGDWSWQIPQS